MTDYRRYWRVAEAFHRHGAAGIGVDLKDDWIQALFVGREDSISELVVWEELGQWTISNDSEYGGFFRMTLDSEDDVLAWLEKTLALPPSREELLSKLLFVMQAPVSGFARALGALAAQREQAAA